MTIGSLVRPVCLLSVRARFQFWDKTARGVDLDSADKTSKAIIAGSAVLTLALGFYSLPALK